MNWVAGEIDIGTAVVARNLGLNVKRRTMGPCPLCNADRRSRTDPRLPCNIHDDRGWFCHACSAGGGTFDLAALVQFGGRFATLDGHQKDELHEWFAERGFVGPNSEYYPSPDAKPLPQRTYTRAPSQELWQLWQESHAANSPDVNSAVQAFLRGRGWSLDELTEVDVCRILPSRTTKLDWPWWWPYTGNNHRIAILWREPNGDPAGLSARSIIETSKPKTLSAAKVERRGLIAANRQGLELLQGKGPPGVRVWCVEGVTGLINMTVQLARMKSPDVVFAGVSGSWSAFAHVNWPMDARIGLAFDSDPTGERYAADASLHLPVHVDIRRINLTGHRYEADDA